MTEDHAERMTERLAPRVGVVALSSPLEVGADRAADAVTKAADVLRRGGCEAVSPAVVESAEGASRLGRRMAEEHVDALVCVPVCWFEDYLVLDMLEECGRPVLFWPQPGMETGALCGTQQITCYLTQLAHPSEVVFGSLDSEPCLAAAMAFLRAAALHSRLRRARIGLVGHHVNGMTHTAPNEFMLKKAIGPRVVQVDLPSLLRRTGEAPSAKAEETWRAVVQTVGRSAVTSEDGIDSMRVYLALGDAVREHCLAALSVGCYPHLMGRVCLAASLLADRGVPLACEGDVHGAIGQLILSLLTGEPTHCTDWLDPLEDGTVVFTHCGSGSFSLAENASDVAIDSVRLMGQGACALFPAKPGLVTLVGLVPRADGYQCALLTGEAMPTEMVFPGNPVRVRFEEPTDRIIRWISRRGIGHHWMIGYGDVADEIRTWADICGPSLLLLDGDEGLNA